MTALRFLLPAILALGGCISWTVIRASGPPSALVGKTSFEVVYDWEGVRIDGMPEASWLADKRAKGVESWEGDRASMEALLLEGTNGPGAPYVFSREAGRDVQVTVDWQEIVPGYFASIASRMTSVVAEVRFSIGGTVVDEIRVDGVFQHSITTPTTGQGLRYSALQIGSRIRKFVEHANK